MNRALQPAGEIAERVERMVIGADFGADGYTTVEQADELAHRLTLRPGLRIAAARAAGEGLTGRCAVVAAGGRHLPFAAEIFDAIVHTDVLC